MARRSKNIESIKAISANFDFSPNPAFRLDCVLKISNGLVKISAKISSKVGGKGGNNLEKNS